MDFDLKVVCDVCGQELVATASEMLQERFGYQVRIKPCPMCLQTAKEGGRDEVNEGARAYGRREYAVINKCSKCGGPVNVSSDQRASELDGYVDIIEPCKTCMQAAKEAGGIEFKPIAGAGPLKHRSYLRPAPDKVAAQADHYRGEAAAIVGEVLQQAHIPDDLIKTVGALVYATLALEASTSLQTIRRDK